VLVNKGNPIHQINSFENDYLKDIERSKLTWEYNAVCRIREDFRISDKEQTIEVFDTWFDCYWAKFLERFEGKTAIESTMEGVYSWSSNSRVLLPEILKGSPDSLFPHQFFVLEYDWNSIEP